MSIFSAILKLAENLPEKSAVIFCQIIVLIYLSCQKKYRAEINSNHTKIFGFYPRLFWLKQSLKIGENLGLMSQIGKNKKILDKTQFYGENILSKVMKSNQSAIVVSFHYGLWEYLPQIFKKLGYDTYIGIEEQRDQNLAIELNKLRNSNGVKVIKTISNMKNVLKSNNSEKPKQLLGFVLDNTSKNRSIRIDEPWQGFSILRTPFVLAKSARVPMLSMFCYHKNAKIIVDIDEVKNQSELGNRLQSYLKKNPEDWIFWGKYENRN